MTRLKMRDDLPAQLFRRNEFMFMGRLWWSMNETQSSSVLLCTIELGRRFLHKSKTRISSSVTTPVVDNRGRVV
jgi:hypothetical protein